MHTLEIITNICDNSDLYNEITTNTTVNSEECTQVYISCGEEYNYRIIG